MNPFLWLLFVLAAAVVATICVALVLGIVKMWRELPPRRRAALAIGVTDHARLAEDGERFIRDSTVSAWQGQ